MWLTAPPICVPCQKAALAAQLASQKARDNEAEWFTREEVKDICLPCYESMVEHNLSKIRKQVLIDKFTKESSMKFTEVIFKGKQGQIYNIGGHALKPDEPRYFTDSELPVDIKTLQGLKDLNVKVIELDARPTPKEITIKKAQATGTKMVMWIGTSPRRTNEYGSFKKNELVAVSDEGYAYCKTNDGFKCF